MSVFSEPALPRYRYTLKIGNATAGVLQTTTEHDATTGQFRSYERMNVTINRGQDTVRMMFITKMIETGEGQVGSGR